MKNKKKLLPLLLLFLVPITVYGAMLWDGSSNVENIKGNLELIQLKMDELKEENGNSKDTIREIQILLDQERGLKEQRERELADKQKEIDNKIAEIQEKIDENNRLKQELQEANEKVQDVDRLRNENAELKTDNNMLESQLEQALKDVKEIEKITDGMVE